MSIDEYFDIVLPLPRDDFRTRKFYKPYGKPVANVRLLQVYQICARANLRFASEANLMAKVAIAAKPYSANLSQTFRKHQLFNKFYSLENWSKTTSLHLVCVVGKPKEKYKFEPSLHRVQT